MLRAEVGLTGIDAPKALAGSMPGENNNRHGAPIAAQLVAPYHSHHFSFRLVEHGHGVWPVINPNRRNAFGQPTGYQVESHDFEEPLLAPADSRRAAFIGHPLWVLAHDSDERYAAGDTPNQNPGSPGLPAFLANQQSLVNRDLVLWVTLGHHHMTQAEDGPVMSMKKMRFELRPANFFDRNPALDLRRAPFEVLTPAR